MAVLLCMIFSCFANLRASDPRGVERAFGARQHVQEESFISLGYWILV